MGVPGRTFSVSLLFALCSIILVALFADAQNDEDSLNMGNLVPVDLRCEYNPHPVGMDIVQPRFSWTLIGTETELQNQNQTAYEIVVTDLPGAFQDSEMMLDAIVIKDNLVWKSGIVNSSRQLHVEYEGKPLASHQRYWWRVRVWDQGGMPGPWSDTAQFSMGILSPDEWQAQWIAFPQETPPSYPHNGYHSAEKDTADTESWVILDAGEANSIAGIRMYPARPYDWQEDSPGFLFPVRYRIDVSDTADFSTCTTVVDATASDVAAPVHKDAEGVTMYPREYNFDAVDGRYVRLYVTRLAAREPGVYAFALAELEVLDRDGLNIALNADVNSSDFIEQGGWARRNLVDGITTTVAPNQTAQMQPASYFRRDVHLDSTPTRATLYVSALGWYQLRLNGVRVGENMLSPEWTDYNQRVTYQTFEVADLMHKGPNALGAVVGAGWYAGHIAWYGPHIYGPHPYFLLQLELEYADGRRETIASDDSWKSTIEGPVRENDSLMGETYDAGYEMSGWDSPGFLDTAWTSAHTFPSLSPVLTSQYNEPIQVTQYLKPIDITEPAPGVYIFDLGQNIAGHCRIEVTGPAGTRIQLRHGEMLNTDGTLYTQNLRSARATDVFIKGTDGTELFEPCFTYHGFRYVEVTGLVQAPDKHILTGCVVHSAASLTSEFESSSELLNDLMEAILWTQRGNLHSTPTDCPQRDERMGWMGDAQVFSQIAIFNMDMARFFTKWLGDIRDAQKPDGQYPDFAPAPPAASFNAPAWADAGVIIPWRMYVNYDDRRILESHYDSAKRYVEYIRALNPDHLYLTGRGATYGDWLNADTFQLDNFPKEGAAVPWDVLSTAFYAHSTDLLSRMADVLGFQDDAMTYSKLFNDIRTAFNRAYVDSDGKMEGDTQAGYALALHFRLYPESMREKAVQHLLKGMDQYDGHLSTGIQSTNRMMLELADTGHEDLAYTLLLRQDFPSWGYMIEQGATTIWERWDGYVEGRGFQNPGMNSFNHYAVGAVGEWVWRHVVGLNPDPVSPGYKHFYIHPRPGGGIQHVTAQYESVRGPIAVAWNIDEVMFSISVTVPHNSSATVILHNSDEAAVTENRQQLQRCEGILDIRKLESGLAIHIASGSYQFECMLANTAMVLD